MVRKEMFRGMALGLAFTLAATSVTPVNNVYASDDQTTIVENTASENENLTADSLDKMVEEKNSTVQLLTEADEEIEVATPSNATPEPTVEPVGTVSSGDANPVVEKVTVTFTTNINVLNKDVLGDVEVTKGETVTPPELLVVGKRVVGWYTTKSYDAGTEFDFSQPVTESMTLYPKLENASAALTLMVNGDIYNTMDIQVNSTISLSNLGIPNTSDIMPG